MKAPLHSFIHSIHSFKVGGVKSEGQGEFGFEMLPSGFALCGIAVAHYTRAGTPAPILGPGGASIRCKSSPQGALRLWTKARLLTRISHESCSGPQAR